MTERMSEAMEGEGMVNVGMNFLVIWRKRTLERHTAALANEATAGVLVIAEKIAIIIAEEGAIAVQAMNVSESLAIEGGGLPLPAAVGVGAVAEAVPILGETGKEDGVGMAMVRARKGNVHVAAIEAIEGGGETDIAQKIAA